MSEASVYFQQQKLCDFGPLLPNIGSWFNSVFIFCFVDCRVSVVNYKHHWVYLFIFETSIHHNSSITSFESFIETIVILQCILYSVDYEFQYYTDYA